VVTGDIGEKLGVDFIYSNELQFEGDVCTGEVLIPSFFHFSEKSLCRHQICKTNAILHACEKYKTSIKDCTVTGDSERDMCIIQHAGLGIAYGGDLLVKNAAAQCIDNGQFSELLNYAV
jgi:phosphoserine phosphatase